MNSLPALREPVTSFDQVERLVRAGVETLGPRRMGVVGIFEHTTMFATAAMAEKGIIKPVLIGNERRIRGSASASDVDIRRWDLINVPTPHDACVKAASMAADGEIDIIFRGQVPAYKLLKILCTRKLRFRQPHELLTHVAAFDFSSIDRLVFMSDGGVVVKPDMDTKIRLLKQAVDVAKRFGVSRPKVALLAAVETVASYMPVGMEEAAIAKMGDRGQLGDCIVDGPLSLDVSISPDSARIKGVKSPVAGQADVLIVPQIEAGNAVYKAIVAFTDAKAGGIVTGTRVPAVILGESDRHENRTNSILLAAWYGMASV